MGRERSFGFGRRCLPFLGRLIRGFSLFPSHEFLDFVVVADKEKDNLIGEFKKDTIFESCADFPIVAMPVFQAKAGRQPSFAIQIVHEGVNGFIYFLLPADG